MPLQSLSMPHNLQVLHLITVNQRMNSTSLLQRPHQAERYTSQQSLRLERCPPVLVLLWKV